MKRQYKQMVVPLDEIQMNPDNPRKDMGDLDALAASFADNGGEPINPPIVAKDGDGYRLFDGERRVRAMRKIGTKTCTVLCYNGFLSAQAAVASMATDQKKNLSDAEAARGFQTCFEAGVGDEEISRASGLELEKVRTVRRVARDAPGQTSLGAMLVAAEFDDPDDRKRVMGSEYPDAEASQIRREQKGRERMAGIREALLEAGVPEDAIVDDTPRDGYQIDGMVSIGNSNSAKFVAEILDGYDPSHAAARGYSTGGYYLYMPADEVKERRAKDPYRSAVTLRDRLCDLMDDCGDDAGEWVVREWQRVSAACTDINAAVASSRHDLSSDNDEDGAGWTHMAKVSKPSMYEVAKWASYAFHNTFGMDYSANKVRASFNAGEAARVWDLLSAAGWVPPEGTPAHLRSALTDESALKELLEEVGADGEDH